MPSDKGVPASVVSAPAATSGVPEAGGSGASSLWEGSSSGRSGYKREQLPERESMSRNATNEFAEAVWNDALASEKKKLAGTAGQMQRTTSSGRTTLPRRCEPWPPV